ncbi:tetratricopeptide repeat protein [Nonlabens ulvanivorans]|uniref:tetratricopeptide repeat protein n=1 Tax=Nonlabens ulvanivorans TaxID=906888 RepID=UPI0037C5802C
MKNNLIIIVSLLISVVAIAQLDKGDELAQTGNWKAAITAYQNAPFDAIQQFKLAQAYTQLGNNAKSITYYRAGFALDSTAIKPMYEYGKLLVNSQQSVDAIPVFNLLIERDSTNASFHYYLGEAWSGLNQVNNAIIAYQKALSLNEDYRVARLDLIKNLIQKREFSKAIKFAKKGIAADSTDVKMNSYLAQAYMNSKWYDKAIPVFERLFELGNDTEYNRNGLAFSYYSTSQYEKSIENYKVYVEEYNDKEASVFFNMSVAYMRIEKYTESIEAIEKAIAIRRPVLDKEYVQLAAVYARNEDIRNAFYALKAAQKERADDAMINYQLAIAADRYFKDKNSIIPYYENYLEIHGKKSPYGTLASERLADLKEAIFMNGDD